MGNSCITVQPDEVVVVEKLGSFSRVAEPGFHCLGCDMSGICIKTHTLDVRVVEVENSTEVIVDNFILRVESLAQVSLDPNMAYEAVYRLKEPRTIIATHLSDIVRGAYCPQRDDQKMFRPGRDGMKKWIHEALSKAISTYGYQVHGVQVATFYPEDTPQWVIDASQALPEAEKALLATREHAQGRKNYVIHQARVARDCMVLQAEGTARQTQTIADGLKRDLGGDAPLPPSVLREVLLMNRYFDSLDKMADQETTIMMPISLGNLRRVCGDIQNFSFAAPARDLPPRQLRMAENTRKKSSRQTPSKDKLPKV